MLVSARELDADTRYRCESSHVEYIENLKLLKDAIQNWMQSSG